MVMPRLFVATACAASVLAAADPAIQQEDLFAGGTGGYHTYRIPALVVTKKGSVLAFAEARKNSGSDHGDIDLVVRRGTNNGRKWSEKAIVHEEGGNAEITIGNPSPVVDQRTGVIHLLFTRNNQRLFHTSSKDDGRTFAPPVEITSILKDVPFPWTRLGAGPGHGIQVRGGRLLIPIWLNEKIRVNYRSGAVYSDDGGKTWRAGGIVGAEPPDTNECMLYERGDGAVVINMRASGTKRRSEAESRDGGLTWSKAAIIDELIDPVCQASVLRTPRTTVFANAASEKRVNMTVRFSRDDGRTWSESRTLFQGPSAYSDLAILPDGTILCLYESGEKGPYERLRLARISR